MKQTRVVFVGGFLGAGKTTLLTHAARRLADRGMVVGVVTNDQAAQLVDTGFLKDAGLAVQEVAGGCFCCRFDQLVDECNRLVTNLKPHVVLGEPVGSCTDISATVLQPMKAYHAEHWHLAPFSVLVDPKRLREALSDEAPRTLPDDVLYIFRKQLEEADVIVLNKADLLSEDERAALESMVAAQFPDTPVLTMSALHGDGIDAWLDRVLHDGTAGRKVVEIDYDRYAEGEAVLGWLNAFVTLHAEGGADWEEFCLALLGALQSECRERGAEVAHAKLLLAAAGGRIVANLTATDGQPYARGSVPGPVADAHLTVNARVHTDPDALREMVETCLQRVAGERVRATVTHLAHFSPSRPNPTHRFGSAV